MTIGTVQNKLTRILQRAADGAYGEDSDVIGKIAGILVAARFDEGVGPFICGITGEPGPDGLAKAYHICPCYGADVQCTGYYERKV